VWVCAVALGQVGNEVPPPLRPLTDRLLAIARAMDERALGIDAPPFSFYVGYNIWDDELVNSSRTGEDGGLAGIEDLINRTRPLGRRVLWDVHVGDKPKTVREWSVFFDHWRALLARLQSQMRAVVLEENGHDHGMLRALGAFSFPTPKVFFFVLCPLQPLTCGPSFILKNPESYRRLSFLLSRYQLIPSMRGCEGGVFARC